MFWIIKCPLCSSRLLLNFKENKPTEEELNRFLNEAVFHMRTHNLLQIEAFFIDEVFKQVEEMMKSVQKEDEETKQ